MLYLCDCITFYRTLQFQESSHEISMAGVYLQMSIRKSDPSQVYSLELNSNALLVLFPAVYMIVWCKLVQRHAYCNIRLSYYKNFYRPTATFETLATTSRCTLPSGASISLVPSEYSLTTTPSGKKFSCEWENIDKKKYELNIFSHPIHNKSALVIWRDMQTSLHRRHATFSTSTQ